MVKYNESTLNTVFSALSDPTRRGILTRLADGEAQMSELAAPFGMSLPAVSKHLRILEKAKLIQRHINGRVHRFTANPAPIASAKSWIETYQPFWEQQLDALGQYLQVTHNKENDNESDP